MKTAKRESLILLLRESRDFEKALLKNLFDFFLKL